MQRVVISKCSGAYQELPPAPMTVIGLQVSAARTLGLGMTAPKRPRRDVTAELLLLWTLLQHWTGPVLHWLAGMVSRATGFKAVGVAETISARPRKNIAKRVGMRANIVKESECKESSEGLAE